MVTVRCTPGAGLRVAVTALAPPASVIAAGVSTTASTGAASSSSITSMRSAGFPTPAPPVTVAPTSTCLCGVTRLSLRAVIVTTPMLSVFPAATLSTLVLSVKSVAVAGGTAVAVTVTVAAAAAA